MGRPANRERGVVSGRGDGLRRRTFHAFDQAQPPLATSLLTCTATATTASSVYLPIPLSLSLPLLPSLFTALCVCSTFRVLHLPLLHISFQALPICLTPTPAPSLKITNVSRNPNMARLHHHFPFYFSTFLSLSRVFFLVFPEHKINTKTLQSHSESEAALRLPTSAFHLHSAPPPLQLRLCLLHVSVIIIILLLLSFCAFHFAVYTTNYATLIEVNFFYFPAATFAVSQTEPPPSGPPPLLICYHFH